MMNWKDLATILLTVQNILWAYSCPGLFSLSVETPLFFLGPRASPLSVRVCLLRARCSLALLTRGKAEPLSARVAGPRGGERPDLGGEPRRWFPRWDKRGESPGLRSYLPSFLTHHLLPLHSWKMQTSSGRRSSSSLTALWEHEGGPVVKPRESEGGLCAQKLSCCNPPPDECQFILFSREDTRGWGGVGVWSEPEGTQRKKARLALATGAPEELPPSACLGGAPVAPSAALEWHVLGEYLCNRLWIFLFGDTVKKCDSCFLFFLFFLGEGADGVSCDSEIAFVFLKDEAPISSKKCWMRLSVSRFLGAPAPPSRAFDRKFQYILGVCRI